MRFLLLLCFLIGLSPLRAQQADSIQFSLLTCAPGQEIYELFGHTAIRYQNFTRNEDYVFNYGMFSFRTPNFVYRFVKGETDYQLGITPYIYFQAEYAMRGSSVYQQVLNLTEAEKQKLYDLLRENYLPQNRIYRYNYFYDNCTTRARDQIEKAVAGTVVYPEQVPASSFREIVHHYTDGFPWDEFGIDLCLGAEADAPIGIRQQMFAPFYMKEFASQAYIVSADGSRRPLVASETKIVDVEPEPVESSFPLSPFACASLFLALNVCIAWLQYRNRRIYWGWDIVLYGIQGITGCVIAFLFFFSVHPTVDSNWMLMLFNPVPLIYLPIMVYRAIRRKKDLYHGVNLVYLTIFIVLFPLCGQKFNLTVLPLALSLLVNAASHVLVSRKRTE